MATEIHVPWNVGDQGKSGLIVLNVSFVTRDLSCVKTADPGRNREAFPTSVRPKASPITLPLIDTIVGF